VLLVAFKSDVFGIADYFLFKGKSSSISCDDYFVSGAIGKIIDWYIKGYKVISIHNHPFSIAALTSHQDIAVFEDFSNKSKWIKYEQKYGIILPNDFCFFDFGIVTKHDYFSYNKNVNNIDDIKKLLKVYHNELNIKPSFLDEDLFMWDPANEFGVSAKLIFDGLNIYFKNRMI